MLSKTWITLVVVFAVAVSAAARPQLSVEPVSQTSGPAGAGNTVASTNEFKAKSASSGKSSPMGGPVLNPGPPEALDSNPTTTTPTDAAKTSAPGGLAPGLSADGTPPNPTTAVPAAGAKTPDVLSPDIVKTPSGLPPVAKIPAHAGGNKTLPPTDLGIGSGSSKEPKNPGDSKTNDPGSKYGGLDSMTGDKSKPGGKAGDMGLPGSAGQTKNSSLPPLKIDETLKAPGKGPTDGAIPISTPEEKAGSKNGTNGKSDKGGETSLAPQQFLPSRWELATSVFGIISGLSILIS